MIEEVFIKTMLRQKHSHLSPGLVDKSLYARSMTAFHRIIELWALFGDSWIINTPLSCIIIIWESRIRTEIFGIILTLPR